MSTSAKLLVSAGFAEHVPHFTPLLVIGALVLIINGLTYFRRLQ